MSKLLSFLLLLGAAMTLTVQVNNIHYGYRNIYVSPQVDVTATHLTLRDYKLTKEELTPDVLGFVEVKGKDAVFDLNSWVRQFQAEEIDPSSPMLTFRFFQKPSIVITIHSDDSESQIVNKLMVSGKDSSALDL